MNEDDTDQLRPPASLPPSRRDLRASLLLPVAIVLAIWVVGLVVYVLTPRDFNTAVALIIGVALLGFLLFWTRSLEPRLRLIANLAALPALAGITAGLITGRSRYAIIGTTFTFLLLILQRMLSTPGSYRAAYRRFQAGDIEGALRFAGKAIEARPDYWRSYQLRALIHLLQRRFALAEQDAGRAIELQPGAHENYNTLGQIYLAEGRFGDARDAYQKAAAIAPDHALYQYYLGFSHYRLKAYRAAAESLAAAIRQTLPAIEYDLLAHYYLGQSLEALGKTEAAQEAYQAMANFKNGLQRLQAQLDGQSDLAYLALLRTDLADLEQHLYY